MKSTRSQQRGLLYLGMILLSVALMRIGAAAPSLQEESEKPAAIVPGDTIIPRELLDLNRASREELDALPGIGKVLADRIVKYRELTGGFKKKEDLLKVFGIRPGNFVAFSDQVTVTEVRSGSPGTREMEKGIQEIDAKNEFSVAKGAPGNFPDEASVSGPLEEKNESGEYSPFPGNDVQPVSRQNTHSPDYNFSSQKPALASIDINSADSISLVKVPGIGAKTASRMMKYKDLLGFYNSVEQLREVYGVSEENFEKMRKYLTVLPPPSPHKVLINTCTLQELARHPYISWKQAKLLIAYREQHGDFRNPEDFGKIHALDHEGLKKAFAYIDFRPRTEE